MENHESNQQFFLRASEAGLGRTDKEAAETENLRPTETVCIEFQFLHDYFNRELFDGELPACMLTVDAIHPRALGYFRPNAFTEAFLIRTIFVRCACWLGFYASG